MNKLSYTICLLFVAQLAYNTGVNGIECFVCQYFETILPDIFPYSSDESCKNGQIPNPVGSCTSSRTFESNKTSLVDTRSTNSTEINQGSIYRCVKVSYDGNWKDDPALGNGRGKAFQGIFRTCIVYHRTPQPKEGCFSGLLGSAFMDEELSSALDNAFGRLKTYLDADTDTEVCICGNDRCNSAFRAGGTSILILFVLGSITASIRNLL